MGGLREWHGTFAHRCERARTGSARAAGIGRRAQSAARSIRSTLIAGIGYGARARPKLHISSKLDDFLTCHLGHQLPHRLLRYNRLIDQETIEAIWSRAADDRGVVGIEEFGDVRCARLGCKADS